MQMTISGKHFDITDAIRLHAEKKISKLPKYFDLIQQVEVIIEGKEAEKGVEIIARGEHNNLFIATESGSDILSCIDMAVHKLEKQLRRKKEKQRNKKHIQGKNEIESGLSEES